MVSHSRLHWERLLVLVISHLHPNRARVVRVHQCLFRILRHTANILSYSHSHIQANISSCLCPCLCLSSPSPTHTHTHTQPIIAFCSGSVQRAKAGSHTLILGSKHCFNSISISQVNSQWPPCCFFAVCQPLEITKPQLLLRTIIES